MTQGNVPGNNASPKLTVATFLPSPIATDQRFGSDANVVTDFVTNVPSKIANNTIYTTSASKGSKVATINNFLLANVSAQLDVVAFDGHANFVVGSSSNYANGLLFSDNRLIRTPVCPAPQFNPELCYSLPTGAATTPFILTSAKVVFVGSCDTGQVFTTWWDFVLPQGQALIIPDLAAMAQLNHVPTIDPQLVDLEQAAVALEQLLNSLAAGKTAQAAVTDANAAAAAFYASGPKTFAQVVFSVMRGDPNACPRCH